MTTFAKGPLSPRTMIYGVNINVDSPEIKAIKTIEDVKKLDIFAAYKNNPKAQADAEAQLLKFVQNQLGDSEHSESTESQKTMEVNVPNTGDLDEKE